MRASEDAYIAAGTGRGDFPITAPSVLSLLRLALEEDRPSPAAGVAASSLIPAPFFGTTRSCGSVLYLTGPQAGFGPLLLHNYPPGWVRASGKTSSRQLGE